MFMHNVSERDRQMAVDGGSGGSSVELTVEEAKPIERLRARTRSNPSVDPVTGADLGAV
jgi:Mn-containing catalase